MTCSSCALSNFRELRVSGVSRARSWRLLAAYYLYTRFIQVGMGKLRRKIVGNSYGFCAGIRPGQSNLHKVNASADARR